MSEMRDPVHLPLGFRCEPCIGLDRTQALLRTLHAVADREGGKNPGARDSNSSQRPGMKIDLNSLEVSARIGPIISASTKALFFSISSGNLCLTPLRATTRPNVVIIPCPSSERLQSINSAAA